MFSLLEKIRGDRKGWRKVSDLFAGMEIAVPTESALALSSSGEDDIFWDEIVSIKHIGREQVWDIEVEGTHNFIGNDIFAHNTYLLRADLLTGTISMNGNVGIGLASGSAATEKLEVAGNVLARGFITDSSADVAESYTTADSSITAGDVVQLDSAGNLVKSNKAYSLALGVISTTPGLLFGGKSTTTKVPLALSGRVPVKVTNENGSIQPGDRLTSSATRPGYAMKMTSSGQSLGVALEDSEGKDKILVFVNLGYQLVGVNLEELAGTATPVPGSASESFVTAFFNNIYAKVSAWMADASNGIGDFFANRVRTKELCVSDDSGETCVTKSQLDNLLTGNAVTPSTPAPSATPTPSESVTPTTEPSVSETLTPTPSESVTPTPSESPTPEPTPAPVDTSTPTPIP